MKSEDIKYSGDGLTMHGRVYWDETRQGQRPGVLVFPEGLGISEHTYGFAHKLAEEGYVALACDYFGGGFHASNMADMGSKFQDLAGSSAHVRARGKAAYDALTARPEVNKGKVAAIGYCFGGHMSIELGASGVPLSAMVGFHSGVGGVTAADFKNIKGRVLVCLGADDPWVPPEQRIKFENDLRAAGVNWQINLYGKVVHSFTNENAGKLGDPNVARYDGFTNRDSWHAMLRLFNEVFN
jgi:dienelactone hydrolase